MYGGDVGRGSLKVYEGFFGDIDCIDPGILGGEGYGDDSVSACLIGCALFGNVDFRRDECLCAFDSHCLHLGLKNITLKLCFLWPSILTGVVNHLLVWEDSGKQKIHRHSLFFHVEKNPFSPNLKGRFLPYRKRFENYSYALEQYTFYQDALEHA